MCKYIVNSNTPNVEPVVTPQVCKRSVDMTLLIKNIAYFHDYRHTLDDLLFLMTKYYLHCIDYNYKDVQNLTS